MNTKSKIRCAVYTRKSSESGLEQDFNSLDAQREAGEAYIKSQKHESSILFNRQYNDGGFSGGTTDRPALQSLLADIKQGLIDVVVVYKVDRLSRSLHDFAKLVELFDQHNVTFVSVTQSFNTKDSMGRLTLNMLLSFAQFEREVTGERIRDKIKASRKKGIWMGGFPPFGYDIVDRKLIINKAEAETVRKIFTGYLNAGSVIHFLEKLKKNGVTGKTWITQAGKHKKGSAFDRGKLYKLLHNRVYIGDAVHKGEAYPGEHRAIINKDLWEAVQKKLAANNKKRDSNDHSSHALLKGLITDLKGNAFSPTYSLKTHKKTGQKIKTYYYINQKAIKHGAQHCSVSRIRLDDIERILLERIRAICTAYEQKQLLHGWSNKSYLEKRGVIKKLIDQVQLLPDAIKIIFHSPDYIVPKVEEVIPYTFRRYGGRKLITNSDGQEVSPRKTNKDPALIKALVRAHKWGQMLDEGSTTFDIAIADGISERYILQIVPFRSLSPEIQEHIISGTQPYTLTMEKLKKGIPLSWKEQKQLFLI